MKHPNSRIDALLSQIASPRLGVIDLSLDRMVQLLAALGNPQDRLPPVVHVAGTNGKGSLLAYLKAMMEAGGYAVHRYTSPHLVRFNERIEIGGSAISDAQLLPVLERVAQAAESHPVTFFEATTAAAFLAFSQFPADVLLLETGLGGRLDATNVIFKPLLTAITPISMDHTEYLGNTLAQIAAEKAGILKDGVPCVTGPQPAEAQAVIASKAAHWHAPLLSYGDNWSVAHQKDVLLYRSDQSELIFPMPSLPGAHQIYNAGTAIACMQALKDFSVPPEKMGQAIAGAFWPARLQRLHDGKLASLLPHGSELWLDGGHNPAAGEILGAWARTQEKPVHIICGMLNNKDAVGFLSPLAQHAATLTAVPIANEPLAQSPDVLLAAGATAGVKTGTISTRGDIKSAIEDIVKNTKNDLIILICGSLYLAGNILWLNDNGP